MTLTNQFGCIAPHPRLRSSPVAQGLLRRIRDEITVSRLALRKPLDVTGCLKALCTEDQRHVVLLFRAVLNRNNPEQRDLARALLVNSVIPPRHTTPTRICSVGSPISDRTSVSPIPRVNRST